MSAQITEPTLPNSNEYLRFSGNRALILRRVYDLLSEGSRLKKGVSHDLATVISSANALLGAMATHRSLETMDQIYTLIAEEIFQQLQRDLQDSPIRATN